MIMRVAELATAPYILLVLKPVPLTLGKGALERMLLVADDTRAAMVYADRYTMESGKRKAHPARR